MDAVKEHRDEMNFNHSIFSHFTAAICNSGGNMKRGVTYKDIYDPLKTNEVKKIDQHSEEGKKLIKESLKMFDRGSKRGNL